MSSSRSGAVEKRAVGLLVVLGVALAFSVAPLAAAAPTEQPAPSDDARSVGAATGDGAYALDQNESGIATMNLSGPGIATRENDTTYVWQDGHTVFESTVYPLQRSGSYELCLELRHNGSTLRDHGCKEVEVSYGGRETFDLGELGTNETGPHELRLTIKGQNDSAALPINVVTKDGDLDGDGLSNQKEVSLGSNITQTDTDKDGIEDGKEVDEYGTDPTRADSDGDGVRDAVEIQEGTDPLDRDSDDDGLTDGEERDEYDTDPLKRDSDGDGIPDGEEVEQGSDPRDENDPTGGDGTVTDASVTFNLAEFVLGLGALLAVGAAAATYVRTDDDAATGDGHGGGVAEASDEQEMDLESIDPELLSPEQYVHRLLEANDGQMKQSDIVDETDWSKAKVSRTLSRMEDDDAIQRVRIGRGNVVTYPENDLSDEI